jgi:hypothetical protein
MTDGLWVTGAGVLGLDGTTATDPADGTGVTEGAADATG